MPSSTEHITRSCAELQKLISQLLEASEELQRAKAHSPASGRAAVLQDKVRKLQAACETQFLKAMDAFTTGKS